ncbi:helix-turn-helix domain-containing protein [Nostocaceae cyanobacterium CENA369]|uniref:Helix-turn-helix domain-containing protein n=1 Tax=Dendronalium phyllosphericum CENA369 TaxID=1725256 RepID=A0A8J7LGR0_9NOST|nr:substrate-binding domain-containing protein [Dendronalium phyllosphericum]MBH8576566.1 helix-turn-helix domain-containing protein [Dendronalium phyllosphericum CENA369]
MKQDTSICNNLKAIRNRLGMSQQELANIVGVTRQSIAAVETGQCAPSVAICLRLAKALGCQVEDLFWLEEEDLPKIEAILVGSIPNVQRSQVSLARIGDRWIAYPLLGRDAFRIEMIPSDGEVVAASYPVVGSDTGTSDSNVGASPVRVDGLSSKSKLPLASTKVRNERHPEGEVESQIGTNKVLVRLLDDIDKLHNTVAIAGCTPVLSLLARATERWHPQLRVHYRFAHSMAALHSLCRGEVHIAGMHLYDPHTGEHNIPFVRKVLTGKDAVLITLGVWEEGLLVQPGNPMKVKTVSDLVEFGATVVTHEVGSGNRMLLERKFQEEQVPLEAVKRLARIVHNHQEVALSIVSGVADAGISTASIAATFGLGFIPLHSARYDLVILKEYLEEAPVQQFLNILGNRLVRSQLQILGGYDISKTGEVVANIS